MYINIKKKLLYVIETVLNSNLHRFQNIELWKYYFKLLFKLLDKIKINIKTATVMQLFYPFSPKKRIKIESFLWSNASFKNKIIRLNNFPSGSQVYRTNNVITDKIGKHISVIRNRHLYPHFTKHQYQYIKQKDLYFYFVESNTPVSRFSAYEIWKKT